MTRCFAFIFWLFAAVSLSFGEERPAMPWIGVMLQQPDSKKERPSEIGTGIGLLVEGVVKNGPLAKAKGQVGDLWWKLDDQILVNMRQLLVLLRMKKVGESVKIHFFREGKLNSQSLTLGSRPPRGGADSNHSNFGQYFLNRGSDYGSCRDEGRTLLLNPFGSVWRV
ncbi:S1C family serine protease [Akkermansiaceae bacterium]|nr:S1C family serine protease [Akkermansiaceae bacterium]